MDHTKARSAFCVHTRTQKILEDLRDATSCRCAQTCTHKMYCTLPSDTMQAWSYCSDTEVQNILKTQICKLWHTNTIKTRLRNANIHRCTFPCCHTDLAWPFMLSHHVSQELPEHPVTQPRGLVETAFATEPSWLASTPCPTPRETRCAGTPWWNLKYFALHCHIGSPLSSQLKLLQNVLTGIVVIWNHFHRPMDWVHHGYRF